VAQVLAGVELHGRFGINSGRALNPDTQIISFGFVPLHISVFLLIFLNLVEEFDDICLG
jgi:hypothetical protein